MISSQFKSTVNLHDAVEWPLKMLKTPQLCVSIYGIFLTNPLKFCIFTFFTFSFSIILKKEFKLAGKYDSIRLLRLIIRVEV